MESPLQHAPSPDPSSVVFLQEPNPAERVRPVESPRFLSYVHSLRGLAILAVVAVHVADAIGWGESEAFSERAIHLLVGNATVLFVFVSGFLFQHLSARFRYVPYLLKRWWTVVVPYLLVSVPTLVHQYWTHSGVYENVGDANPIVVATRAYLTGAQMPVPLWYVPMIVLFFLASPLLIGLDRRKLLAQFIFPTLILGTLLHRSHGHRLVWQSALYFLPAYLAGMWTSHNRERVLGLVARYRLPILAATIALFLIEAGPLHHNGPVYSRHPFSTEAGVIDLDLSVKILLTLLLLDSLRRFDATVRNWFSRFADASFGIFFLHGYLIFVGLHILRRHFPTQYHLGVGGYLIGTVAVAGLSLGGVALIQRLLGSRSRYVIGC